MVHYHVRISKLVHLKTDCVFKPLDCMNYMTKRITSDQEAEKHNHVADKYEFLN